MPLDTATEVQAYYITQVEKISKRYEKLCEVIGEDEVINTLDAASREILDEFLTHAKAVRKERELAKIQNTKPNFLKLIRQWGGVTIAYRRRMQDSPAYINNHEELKKALEEGVYYASGLEPSAVALNQYGHVETLVCHRRICKNADDWETTTEEVRLPARSILVATGTQPNVAYEFEHKGTFARQRYQYQHYEDQRGELLIAHGISHCKEPGFGPFTSYQKDHLRVSLIGDTHPVFHGNVVKAIASGMRTYPKILEILSDKLGKLGDIEEYENFANHISNQFNSRVANITRRTENVIELTIKSPLAASHYRPGHFYRLQNYETYARKIEGTVLQMEPLALICSGADHATGNLNFIIIESGTTAKICSTLKIGDPVSLMGPTGIRNKIAEERETILIIGNQLSLALLKSYGPALRAAGNRVIYIANFKNKSEVYCQDDIENAADVIIWCVAEGEKIVARRSNDYSVTCFNMDVLVQYARGQLAINNPQPSIPLQDVDRIHLIGNSQFLRTFQEARHTVLKEFLVKDPRISGSVYSTMQCMLKGVCAQCLQWQIDPETGVRTKAVFACSWPDQPLELIDFDNIDERLIQNKLQEHLSNLWINYIFTQDIERI